MTTAIAKYETGALEQAAIVGDLSKLNPEQRLAYYQSVCQSTGLNPLTKPFDYIMLNGKLTLYCKKDAADQLRKLHNVSVKVVGRETIEGVHVVTAQANTPDGRTDEEIGAVTIANLKGDALANALMKAVTKAKRRVTLSICGLGWLDETELETIRDAKPVYVDHHTGEVMDEPSGFKPLAAALPTIAQPADIVRESVAEPEYADLPDDDDAEPAIEPDVVSHLKEQIRLLADGKSDIPEYQADNETLAKTAQSRIKAIANGKSAAIAEAIIGHPLPRWSALTRPESTVLCWWFSEANRDQAAASVVAIAKYLGLS